MENTIENKEKFFGIYLGANICDWEGYKLEGIKGKYSTFLGKRNEIDVWVKTSALSLLLKPLQSISDEDAIEVAKMFTNRQSGEYSYGSLSFDIRRVTKTVLSDYQTTIVEYDDDINLIIYHDLSALCFQRKKSDNPHLTLSFFETLKAYQFLQSKGYALPYMDLSVEDLQNYGWIKLAE